MSSKNYFSYCGCDDCYFTTAHYGNGNLAVEIFSSTEGPVSRVTVNPNIELKDNVLAIKNWSENSDIEDLLHELNIIEKDPEFTIPSGYVEIPIYKITDNGRKILQLDEIIPVFD